MDSEWIAPIKVHFYFFYFFTIWIWRNVAASDYVSILSPDPYDIYVQSLDNVSHKTFLCILKNNNALSVSLSLRARNWIWQ